MLLLVESRLTRFADALQTKIVSCGVGRIIGRNDDNATRKKTELPFMTDARLQIEEIVNRETRAWDIQDVDLLISIFHHDMVWPWPRTSTSHDPMDWVMVLGRFNAERWKQGWQELFDA